MSEIHDIVEVEVKGEYGLRVTFDDGAVRDVSLEGQLDGPVFEPLRDPELSSGCGPSTISGNAQGPRVRDDLLATAGKPVRACL